MAKTSILVRHAEAEHNVKNSQHIKDATLTETGKAQCRELQDEFSFQREVQLVVTSPLRRAVQTAVLSFGPILRRLEHPLILLPQAQEISALPCDIGSGQEQLENDISNLAVSSGIEPHEKMIDYSLLEKGWNEKTGTYQASLRAVEQRAAYVRKWLWKRHEKFIVLVTHGSFLHYLTEDWTGFVPENGTAYANCEFRCFVFTEESNELDSSLVEVGNTKEKMSRPAGIHAELLAGISPIL